MLNILTCFKTTSSFLVIVIMLSVNSIIKTELYVSADLEEYDLSVKEKMYQKASTNDYKELKAYVETLSNSEELNPLNYFT